ncbi:unnamed protein product [Caenorhabditis sp. 36 PRJEB53466]|nr:unnamed protein product [Caenorhabditis sp. 36 PRJEB53466]
MQFLTAFLLTAVLVYQTTASGVLTFHLKSAHAQKATIILSSENEPTYLVLPIILQKESEMKFGEFVVDFRSNYTATIIIDETSALGVNSSIYHAQISPVRGTIAPQKLNLPLTGIRLDFECDQDWHGAKCDAFCEVSSNCTAANEKSQSEVDLEFAVDYTVNPQKLEKIVEMLKKENEVENWFKSQLPRHRETDEKINVIGSLPPFAADKEQKTRSEEEEEGSAELMEDTNTTFRLV